MNPFAIFLVMWTISIPVLGLIALVIWFKRLRTLLPVWRSASLSAVLMNWGWFLWLARAGEIGGFGSHDLTTRSADQYLLIPLVAIGTSFALKSNSRLFAIACSFLMFTLWGGSEMVA